MRRHTPGQRGTLVGVLGSETEECAKEPFTKWLLLSSAACCSLAPTPSVSITELLFHPQLRVRRQWS